MERYLRIIIVVFMTCLLGANGDGCSNGTQASLSGATQVTSFTKVPLNSRGNTAEQQNIIDRLEVTTNPTKVMWIHLVALDGKIIKRMPVRTKVTSSGKRLEPNTAANSLEGYPSVGQGSSFDTNELIQPDGTYGGSDSYIFWFDPMGRYHQWGTAGGLGYLLTDYPIDLQNPINEITGLYNVQKEALEWQKQQEQGLKDKERALVSKSQKPAVEVIPTQKPE